MRKLTGAFVLFFATAVIIAQVAPLWAQRTDQRDMRRAVKYLEEDPDYLKKLPKVIWRRPMGPYVKDVWPGYHGGPGPAEMVVKRSEHQLKVLGANFLLIWDDRRGGEISEIFLFDGSTWKHVNCTMAYMGRDTIPRYAIQRQKDFHGDSPVYYLNQAIGTKFNITRKTSQRVEFTTENHMVTTNRERSPWVVRQKFTVYSTGVVVCDFEIELAAKEESFPLRHAQMGAYLEDILFKEIYVKFPVHFRWGSADYGEPVTSNANWKTLDEERMVPMGSASFGTSRFADFTNRFEFWLERPKPFISRRKSDTRTQFKVFSSGLWYEPSDMSTRPSCGRAYEWELHKGDPVAIKPPFSYRNRWVLAVGGAKVSRIGTGAARRNNLVGARIARWDDKAYPTDATLRNLAKMGADVLVLGEGWHKPKSAEAVDTQRLTKLVRAARSLGMRVVLSVPLALSRDAEKLFEKILSRGHDGLLVESLGPASMPRGTDLAARIETLARLRELVGEDGILIGRAASGQPAQIEMAFLDAVTPANDVAGRLLNSPGRFLTTDAAIGCALSPIVPSDDDRLLARFAAVPVSPQVRVTEDTKDHALLPLWKLMSKLDGPVTHVLSPRLENVPDLRVEPKTFPVVAYLTESRMLLIIANSSGKGKCKVSIAEALGVKPNATGKMYQVIGGVLKKESTFQMSGGVIEMTDLAAGEVRAYEFPRRKK